MKNKINILQIITSLNIGGTERFLLNTLRYLKDDFNFYVGYLKERGPIAEEIEKLNIPIFRFEGIRAIKRFIQKNSVDMVHTHLYRANIVGRIAAKLAGTKHIISSQRSIDRWKRFYQVWLDSYTSRFCQVIIANSQAAKNILVLREKIPQEKIHVVYNGINVDDFKPTEHLEKLKQELDFGGEELIVGTITRFHKEKGIFFLPSIVEQVKQRFSQVKFLVVGDGPQKSWLTQIIKSLHLEETVSLLGWRYDLANILNIMQVFFLASEEESFPQAVLEALACSRPVVVPDIGGIKEIIQDGKDGLIVAPDQTTSLAQGIIKILLDKETAKKMGQAGYELVKREFSLKKMVDEIKTIYQTTGG